ncbi:hypothetical protein [Phenylobacterium sp.]|uniref:hypothetical protein n=1 Tax=Phenylobacterium sp. TaxID=1871053 RepID=UPI0035AF2A2B
MTKPVDAHHEEEVVERLEKAEGRLGRVGIIVLALAAVAITVAFFSLGGGHIG